MLDCVIRDVAICDGTGRKPVHGDLGISGGRIASIGGRGEAAAREIRGSGLVAAPGFIDVHTHYDCQVCWDPALSPSSWHGVTTVVMGNCGFSIAPCRPEHRDLLIEMLLYVEGMPTEALKAGLRWEWQTFPEYLDAVERFRPAVNVAAFVGHSAVRFWVMGADATRREASPAELDSMRAVVRDAIDAGAIGFSTSESPTHFFGDGTPVPSRVPAREELRALAGVLGALGRGIVEIAPLHTIGGSTEDRMRDQEFYAELARQTQRPVTWAPLHHSPFDPEGCLRLIESAAEAQRSRAPVYPQVGCKPLEVRITFDAMGIAVANNPYWKPIFERPKAERRELFRTTAFRDELREHSRPGGWVAMLAPSWEKIFVRTAPVNEHAELIDLSIAEVARSRGADPVDALLDVVLESDLRCQIGIPIMNDDEEYVAKLLRHPAGIVALSDAGAHVDSLADQGFTSTLLSRWVREKKTLAVEEAVRLVSSVPARIYGLEGRGELGVGNPADVVAFDPDRVGSERVELVADLPGGAARLLERPRGIEWGAPAVAGDGGCSTDGRGRREPSIQRSRRSRSRTFTVKETKMTTEQNKDFVKRTWQALLQDVEGALASFSDDVTWFITGKLDGVSGVKKGKQAVRAFLAGVGQAFPAGLKTEIKNTYGDGDTVIIELVNRGTSATGKPYENEYCFVLEVAAGKIRAVREYVDLEKAKIALSR